MKNYYAHIKTETGRCVGIVGTAATLDREDLIYIGGTEERTYCGKYYHDGQWWARTWNEYETVTETREDGVTYERTVPVESAGYMEEPWAPSNTGAGV